MLRPALAIKARQSTVMHLVRILRPAERSPRLLSMAGRSSPRLLGSIESVINSLFSTGLFPRLLASTRPPFAFCISHFVSPHFALRPAESLCFMRWPQLVLPEQSIAPISIVNAAVAVPLNIQSSYPENPESLKSSPN